MTSSNFYFLQMYQPEMAELARSAENYAYCDPQSAAVKLRCFAEIYVGYIYRELELPSHDVRNFFEKLDNKSFKNVIEDCVVEKLHLIRIKGNRAAHPYGVSISDALTLVKEAFFLSAWIYVSFHGGKIEDLPKYRKPKPIQPEDEVLLVDKKRLEQEIERQTAELQQARAELREAENRQREALPRHEIINQEVNLTRLEGVRLSGRLAVSSMDFEPEVTRQNITIEDIFAEYQLTQGQTETVTLLDAFLNGRDHSVFLLKGYAGTGKTFITKGLTEYFRAIGRNYILAAPTGKASKVIANKTRAEAYTIHKTIYSFKDIKEYKVEDMDGTETYKYYAELAVNENSVDTVYIIDESSMISDVYNESEFFRFGSGYLLVDFLKFVNLDHNDHSKKLIFIGDDAQLPPVNMSTSPALDPVYLRNKYGLETVTHELTEVVRQKTKSGVMHNAVIMRNALKINIFNKLDIELGYPDLQHVEYEDFISYYLDSCRHKINAESIVIAYSNADVAAYNRRIREEFFPNQPDIANGDKIMAVSNSDVYGFFICNGDFGQVNQVRGSSVERRIKLKRKASNTSEVVEIPIQLKFREIEAGFRDLYGKIQFFTTMIVENLLYSDTPNLSSDENKAMYLDFCMRYPGLKRGSLEFKETLRSDPYFNALRVKFGYAITCHKAQGSEWPNVFVKCSSHQKQLTADYFRWLYTAITRTSNKLYLLDEPHIKLGGDIDIVKNPGLIRSSEGDDLSPTSNDFLTDLFSEVCSLIAHNGIEIYEVQHHQYLEAYIFARGAETARVNITYNGKQKITSVVLPQSSRLGGELLKLLNPLKNRLLTAHDGSKDIISNEAFLVEFHQRIETASRAASIEITNVERQQYSQRYYFYKDGERVAVDIYYNKKKQFTSANPVDNNSSHGGLLSEVLSLIKGLA